ncbi:helicase HerA-like domain-containing protein [Flavobacterium sp. DG1-102-2]|uniref:helicase HerA-like domain-containing protein n=1 Tax=Flavobacterium sp. DG1-102-2 TaxID=3081663 RepID=UPI002948C549|nr:helicase HerA-like domain-containing protein [Flavobacterium sp. DG1-102-2]MDV6168848.1 helicase HerA-like domain-containing protein [Flavobacterium sp. DG1-102-2]
MADTTRFLETITNGYQPKGSFITLGTAMLDGEPVEGAYIKIPLKTMNRHGLIAGATGTGKTKTLQVLAEQLSENGVPVLMMDIKGDLSGIAKASEVQPFITERHAKIGLPYEAKAFPAELMSLSKQQGVRLRSTVSEFGPVLFSRVLGLNDTQTGVVNVIFKYCDDNNMPLLDLKDIKKVLQYITDEGKAEIEKEYGMISTSSSGAILRKIIELEQQDADLFFGELSFDVKDLMRIDDQGRGYVNIIRLTDIQDKPKLFSTFMLSLLAEIYNTMPEKGDADQPELVIFIDEAHLIFDEASKALLDQIETIVKLIRSKGVGIFFVTQNPADVPNGVLSQLGLKVQHALRAFTATDRKAIKLAAENYPITEFYKTDEIITQLGTGEALVTALSEKGNPTPLAATMLRAPMSRMDILTADEISTLNASSRLVKKYSEAIDRESAYEILCKKVEAIEAQQTQKQQQKAEEKAAKAAPGQTPSTGSTIEKQIIKTVTSATFIRGVFGVLSKIFK